MRSPAARLTDQHVCPMVTGIVPHVGGPIVAPCMPTVLIGAMPAARVTDMAVCVGPPDAVATGSPTVLIGGLPATRIGENTVHGGTIVTGFPTVLIGDKGAGNSGGPHAGAGAGGAAPGGAQPRKKLSVGYEHGVKKRPFDDEFKKEQKLAVDYNWGKAKTSAFSYGDEDNNVEFLTASASADSEFSYDLDKGEVNATVFDASVAVAAVDAKASAKALKDAADFEAAGSALKAGAQADIGASLDLKKGTGHIQAKGSAEAMLVEGSAKASLRITPKTIFDNTVGRVTGKTLSKSWDWGLVVGAEGHAGLGAAASGEASAKVTGKEAKLTLGGKLGLGPSLGLKAILGVTWP